MPGTANLALLTALLLAGLATTAWLFAPAFGGPEAARRGLGTHRLALGMLAVLLFANALLTLPLRPLLPTAHELTTGTFLVLALATQLPMPLLLYARVVAPGALSWRELGLRPLPLARVAGVGILTGLAGLAMTVVLGAFLSQLGLRQNQLEQFRFVRGEGPGGFLLVLLAGVVVAPFVEELFFRGFLFGQYRRRQPLWVAYLAAGVPFALLHLDPSRMDPPQMAGLAIGILALGSLLAWTYQRTGSLYPGMVAHGVNNAAGLGFFYLAGLT